MGADRGRLTVSVLDLSTWSLPKECWTGAVEGLHQTLSALGLNCTAVYREKKKKKDDHLAAASACRRPVEAVTCSVVHPYQRSPLPAMKKK
jgi:hypothetical protein